METLETDDIIVYDVEETWDVFRNDSLINPDALINLSQFSDEEVI